MLFQISDIQTGQKRKKFYFLIFFNKITLRLVNGKAQGTQFIFEDCTFQFLGGGNPPQKIDNESENAYPIKVLL